MNTKKLIMLCLILLLLGKISCETEAKKENSIPGVTLNNIVSNFRIMLNLEPVKEERRLSDEPKDDPKITVMVRKIFKSNHHFCIDVNDTCEKACYSYCIDRLAPDCLQCHRDCKDQSNKLCKVKIKNKIKRHFRSFTTAKRCGNIPKHCESLCADKECRGTLKLSDNCKLCEGNCEKAAKIKCLTKDDIKKKFKEKVKIKYDFVGMFKKNPVLCVKTKINCRKACTVHCIAREKKDKCIVCQETCNSKGKAFCPKAEFHPFLERFYKIFSKKLYLCDNGKKYCESKCRKEACGRFKDPDECNECKIYCQAAVPLGCTQGMRFIQLYVAPKTPENNAKKYVLKFNIEKESCLDIDSKCKDICFDKCMADAKAKVCVECGMGCKKGGEIACKKIKFHPFAKMYFLFFKKNKQRCKDYKLTCRKDCDLKYCKGRKVFGNNCLNCHTSCKIGGKVACKKKKKGASDAKVFAKMHSYFGKKSYTLKCSNCNSELRRYCFNECGQNIRCNSRCNKLGPFACISNCNGSYSGFYYGKFNAKFRNQFMAMKERCSNCNYKCERSCSYNCFSIDIRCKSGCVKVCGHQCKLKNCKRYSKDSPKKKARKKQRKTVAFGTIKLETSRYRMRQALRNQFDEDVEEKVRNSVFRKTRDEVIKAIDLGEKAIYAEQKVIIDQQKDKTFDYEEELYYKLKVIYANEKNYAKMITPELDIFQD